MRPIELRPVRIGDLRLPLALAAAALALALSLPV